MCNQNILVHTKRPFFCLRKIRPGKDGMNSFMSWVGGKKALREVILERFPLEYTRYIEVFGGGGWVLFYKPPGKDFEVYNDRNRNLVNLYRCVKHHPMELIDELTFTLNAREEFDYAKQVLETRDDIPDIERAAYYYQIICQSYASGLESFAAQPRSMWSKFPLIMNASARLQGVVIENRDFERVIRQYDRPESFFYCDPPYYTTEDYYKDVGFTTSDHERLADCLAGIEGKFLLSYNDCPEIRDLYDGPEYRIESLTRLHNMKQRFNAGEQFPELLISNYDTQERREAQMQIPLIYPFNWDNNDDEEEIE